MRIAAHATGLSKHYGSGSAEVVALDGVDFEVVAGEFTAIMGPSGSGKSTLMHLMAALDSPTSGKVFIGDTDVALLKDTPLTELRRDRIGFIFQAFNLVPTLSARENIVLPLAIAGKKVDQEWFDRIVDVLGLANRLTHKPSELSGGQQQRVACARALMNRPDIVFGDEPTGNLDSASAAEVLAFLRRSVDEFGQTVVMVTHDALSASYADRQVFLSDGRIIEEMRGASQDELLRTMARIYPRHDQPTEPEAPTTAATETDAIRDIETGADGPLDTFESDVLTDSADGASSSAADRDVFGPASMSHEDSTEELPAAAEADETDDGAEESGAEPENDDEHELVNLTDAVYRDGGSSPRANHRDDDLEPEAEQTIPRRAIAG